MWKWGDENVNEIDGYGSGEREMAGMRLRGKFIKLNLSYFGTTCVTSHLEKWVIVERTLTPDSDCSGLGESKVNPTHIYFREFNV